MHEASSLIPYSLHISPVNVHNCVAKPLFSFRPSVYRIQALLESKQTKVTPSQYVCVEASPLSKKYRSNKWNIGHHQATFRRRPHMARNRKPARARDRVVHQVLLLVASPVPSTSHSRMSCCWELVRSSQGGFARDSLTFGPFEHEGLSNQS